MTQYDRPFRLRVLDALTDALKEITPANGYRHDLSESVFRGRSTFGDDDPLPMVSVLEPPKDLENIPSPPASSTTKGGWDLMVQGFVDDDKINPTDPAYFLHADVKRRLALVKRETGGQHGSMDIFGIPGCVNLAIDPGIVRPPDEISAKAYFWLFISFEVVEDLADPYSDP